MYLRLPAISIYTLSIAPIKVEEQEIQSYARRDADLFAGWWKMEAGYIKKGGGKKSIHELTEREQRLKCRSKRAAKQQWGLKLQEPKVTMVTDVFANTWAC